MGPVALAGEGSIRSSRDMSAISISEPMFWDCSWEKVALVKVLTSWMRHDARRIRRLSKATSCRTEMKHKTMVRCAFLGHEYFLTGRNEHIFRGTI